VRLAFRAEVWEWRGPAPYYFVTVPEPESGMLAAASGLVTYGWGMVPCAVTVGDTTMPTALWPKDGGYIVPLKSAMRAAETIELGDTINVELEVNV
jgi:hypothetical protein